MLEQSVPSIPSESLYLRVIDASANRAREALRVLEDFVRFVHDDAFLSENFKNLRHRLVQNILKFPLSARLSNRETQADVGTRISTRTEFLRDSLEAVLEANFSRLQESLRSLEEFSKLTQPETSHEFEQMRYFSYTLQRVLFFAFSEEAPRRRTLRGATTAKHIIVPLDPSKEKDVDSSENVNEYRLSGPDGSVLCFTTDLAAAQTDDFDGFIKDAGAPVSVRTIRALLGPERLIGVVVLTETAARRALLDGIDFLMVPILNSESNSELNSGLNSASSSASCALFQTIRRLTTIPVFRINDF